MDSPSVLTVAFAETAEQKKPVIAFVDREYKKVYATTPPPADMYSVVMRGDVIVSCVGLDYADQDGYFLIERTYCLDRHRLPHQIDEKNTAQLGRWVSHEKQMSIVALYHLLRYALKKGRQWGLVEHTEAVHRVVRRMGVVFWDIPMERVDFSVIAPHNRPYYEQRLMRPYMVDFAQMENVLSKVANYPVVCITPY